MGDGASPAGIDRGTVLRLFLELEALAVLLVLTGVVLATLVGLRPRLAEGPFWGVLERGAVEVSLLFLRPLLERCLFAEAGVAVRRGIALVFDSL